MNEPAVWSFGWWTDVAQIVGAIISLVALVVAFSAIYLAKRDLAEERRTTHELEVLRGLNDLLLAQEGEHIKVYRCYLYLLLIPEPDDLPLTRAAVGAQASEKALSEFAKEFPGVPDLPPTGSKEAAATERLGRLLLKGDWHREEIHAAIERRLASRPGWWARQWPSLRRWFSGGRSNSATRAGSPSKCSTNAPGEPLMKPPGEPLRSAPAEPQRSPPDEPQ